MGKVLFYALSLLIFNFVLGYRDQQEYRRARQAILEYTANCPAEKLSVKKLSDDEVILKCGEVERKCSYSPAPNFYLRLNVFNRYSGLPGFGCIGFGP